MSQLFKFQQVYPAIPDPLQMKTELEMGNAASLLGFDADGNPVLSGVPSVPDSPNSVRWDEILDKPDLFPTKWELVQRRPTVLVPPGSMVMFFGNNAVQLTGVYADDAAAILLMDGGTSANPFWRVCDGTNGTPDLRGRFVLGAGQGSGLTNRVLGATGGEEAHVLTESELAAHVHGLQDGNGTDVTRRGGGPGVSYDLSGDGANVITTESTGSGAAHNTMPPFYVAYPIIRTERLL